MKKLVFLAFAAALCFVLCACGGEGKIEFPVIPETDPPFYEDEKPKEPVQEEPNTPVTDNRIYYLEGQWLLAQETEGAPKEIFLDANGQCTVDGESYSWSYSYENGNRFGVNILTGETVAYEISFARWNGPESVVLLYTDNDRGVYINPAHYDVIEITPENWENYFELRRTYYWDEDAFGEVTRLRGCGFTISLKEEYVSRLSSAVTDGDVLTKNAMEVSYSYGRQPYELDLQNKTCTPVEGQYTHEGTYTEMDNLTYHSTLKYYQMDVWPGMMYSADEETLPYLYDFTLLRANCPLYLLKEEFAIRD